MTDILSVGFQKMYNVAELLRPMLQILYSDGLSQISIFILNLNFSIFTCFSYTPNLHITRFGTL